MFRDSFCNPRPFSFTRLLSLVALVGGSCLLPLSGTAQEEQKITFDDHVAPIFNKRCAGCHNSNKRSGDLDVTSFTNFMQGGSSGTVIEPGDPGNSYLYMLITHEESPEMPPGGKIPDDEIALVKTWIEAGALQNQGSKAMVRKPKFSLAMSGSATVRPEIPPTPARLPLEPVLRAPRAAAVPAIATSPWVPLTAIAGTRQVLLYDTQTLELKGVLPGTGGRSKALRFSRNGSVLLTTDGIEGGGAKVRLWDIPSGNLITELASEVDTILAADISPDLGLVAVGGPQRMVRVYNTADGSLRYEIKKHTDWVTALEFSPDGKYLASGDRNGGLHVWRVEGGEEHLTLKAHTAMISAVSWRWDGNLLASGSEDTTIRLWEMEEGKQVKNWGAHGGGLTGLEFSRDGQLVSCGRDQITKIWQQDGNLVRQIGGLPDVAVATSFCDESQRLVTSDWTGGVQVYQVADGAVVGQLDANPPTLQERITASSQQVEQLQQAWQPLAEQVKTTETGLADQMASLKTTQESRDAMQQQVATWQQQVTATQQQLASTQAEQAQWKQELDQKMAAQPTLVAARDASAKAVAALPESAELKAASDQVAASLAQLEARIAELNQLVTQSMQKKATTEQQLASLMESLQTATQQLQTLDSQVAELEKTVGALNDQLAAQKTQADTALANLETARQQLTRWQGEQQFITALNDLNAQLAAANETLGQEDAEVAAVMEKLKAVQAEVDAAQAERQQAEASVETLEQQLNALKGIQ